MAILTITEKAQLREKIAQQVATVSWTKEQIDSALQAIENNFEATKASYGAAIETAVPGVFSAQQKVRLVKYWLWQKFSREA